MLQSKPSNFARPMNIFKYELDAEPFFIYNKNMFKPSVRFILRKEKLLAMGEGPLLDSSKLLYRVPVRVTMQSLSKHLPFNCLMTVM